MSKSASTESTLQLLQTMVSDYGPPKIDDLLGAGKAIEKGIDSVTAFLKTLFGPATIETGEVLADPIRAYRRRCASEAATRAAEKLASIKIKPSTQSLGPVIRILEEASVVDDPNLQEKWASLLARAVAGPSDAPLTPSFVEMLRQLSPTEGKILDWMFSSYRQHRNPLHSKTMIDPWVAYQSNCFRVDEFVGEFESSRDVCDLAFANLVRLGICDNEVDEEGFRASLAGKVVIQIRSTEPRVLVRLSDLGVAFLEACCFPESVGGLSATIAIDADSDEDDDSTASPETSLLEGNEAVKGMLSNGIPLERIVELLKTSPTFQEFRKGLLISGEPGYGRLALHPFEHDSAKFRELNEARVLAGKPPFVPLSDETSPT